MNRTIPWLAAAALLGSLSAQDAPSAKPDAATRLAAFQKRQQQVVVDWRKSVAESNKAAEAAKKEGKQVPAMAMRPDFRELRRDVLAAAGDYQGEDQGKLLVFAFEVSGKPDEYSEVLDLMIRDHVADATLAEIGPSLGYLDQIVGEQSASAAYARIAASAKHPRVLGWLAHATHGKTIASAAPDSDAFQAAKKALLAAVEKAGDERLTDVVRTELVEKEHFAIGGTAPDIEGEDLDGVPFKLSDYKGKVLFVDFWGDW